VYGCVARRFTQLVSCVIRARLWPGLWPGIQLLRSHLSVVGMLAIGLIKADVYLAGLGLELTT
jgi:hypothetical protein